MPGTIPCVTALSADPVTEFLLSAAGRTLLAEAETLRASRADTLTALTRLRKQAAPEQAAAAWEMTTLRERGRVKFGPQAEAMFFVREALEQASGLEAAQYHAARFREAGMNSVADLGGGIGGDSLAFARAGLQVTLWERDPARALFAEENARVWGLSDRITVKAGDVIAEGLEQNPAKAVWLDPARRVGSRRVSDPEDYAPPLSWLSEVSGDGSKNIGVSNIGVKLSPAIDHALAAQYGAELEFLSAGGECREALLWLGGLKTGDRLRATVLTSQGPQTVTGPADTAEGPSVKTGRYLYEPDPAVIRAHLVRTLAAQLGAAPVDPHIAYLLGDHLRPTPFAVAYEVTEQFPYSRRRLQDALTARQVGRVIIKKRGFPLEPEALRKQLTLRGDREIIVVLARVGAGHIVYLCQES